MKAGGGVRAKTFRPDRLLDSSATRVERSRLIQQSKQTALPPDAHIGWLFGTLCLGVALYAFAIDSNELMVVMAGLATVLFVLAKFAPHSLRQVNILWMGASRFLGKVVSPVVLCLLFFFVLTPYALILRLTGRDELGLRRFGSASYWRDRDTEYYRSRSFRDQF